MVTAVPLRPHFCVPTVIDRVFYRLQNRGTPYAMAHAGSGAGHGGGQFGKCRRVVPPRLVPTHPLGKEQERLGVRLGGRRLDRTCQIATYCHAYLKIGGGRF